jgi:beta-lactamase superfamily II metal-dependent hydrolase
MYRVGELGDCFLLTIIHDDVSRNMLIDCGSFRNGGPSVQRMTQIANDIARQVGPNGKLDIVVGTHQHNDHVSGFAHAEDIFRKIGVEQVWLSWLDNPRSKVATSIGESHLELRKSLKVASDKIRTLASKKTSKMKGLSVDKVSETGAVVDGLLSFFGAAPELPAKGISILKDIGEKPVDYLSPGDMRTLPGIPGSEVRVHVLGPPRNKELLYRKDPRKGESYDHELRAMNMMALHFVHALNNRSTEDDKHEEQFPFNSHYKRSLDRPAEFGPDLKDIYQEYQAYDWRNIDSDWLEQAARLALYMDTFTNNSSLVLAIELVKSGKVLLFAGDAQTGNWLSWQNVTFKERGTSIDSLLARTVLYKVGHHGSHNSTLKPAFEKMTSEELVAMIPVDKRDGNITKKNGWKMPAAQLYQALKQQTNYRILSMDDGYADGCDPSKNPLAKKGWRSVGAKPKITPLYIEYTVS